MKRIISRLLLVPLLVAGLAAGVLGLATAVAPAASARSCAASIYPHSHPNAIEIYTIKIRTNPCGERISAQIYCRSSHRWRYGRIHTLPGKTSSATCGALTPIRRWGWRDQVAAGLPWTFHQVGYNPSA